MVEAEHWATTNFGTEVDIVATQNQGWWWCTTTHWRTSSRGFITQYKQGNGPNPGPHPGRGGEVGSGHIANGLGDTLAYVYIAKNWTPPTIFKHGIAGTSTTMDGCGHIYRRKNRCLAHQRGTTRWKYAGRMGCRHGWGKTTVYVTEGREGKWTTRKHFASSKPGERVHLLSVPMDATI